MSFIVWAHHMFITGMGTTMAAFFQTTTMIISIPSVVILSSLIISLYGGSIRFTTPMLFALGFLPMFGIGGLTGLPLGLTAADIHLHDTYYVIGHFHYVVAPGTIFGLFAGIYYWFPKATGRMMNETLGRLHFFGSFVFMNVIFMPMFIMGLAGVSRRLYDGGASYAHAQGVLHWNVVVVVGRLGARALPAAVHLQLLLEHLPRQEGGRQPLARDDARVGRALAAAARQLREPAARRTAGPTSTAFRAPPGTTRRSGRRWAHEHGDPLHRRGPARHRAHQRQARHLAVPGLRGDAVRRAVRVLRDAARRRRSTGRPAPRTSTSRSPRSTP